MTVVGYLRERPASVLPEVSRDRVTASGIAARARLAGRVPQWCWPALLTLALGFYQVGRPELWRDELSSWSFGTRPLSSLIATARHTGATQLAYYLLLHVWITAFGDGVDAMRALSVLAMAGAAACVTAVGRRLAGTRAGLCSGLVFALVPSVSRFAQEVRFYSLEVLAAMLATLLLMRALDRPSARRWAAYAACLAVLGYIDLVALSVVAGHAAGVALRWHQDRDRRQLWFAAAAAAALAACLPLVVLGSAQAANQVKWIPKPGLDLAAFSLFGRNLFYSTSVATALIVLAVLAWAVAWQRAAFMTAIAVLPVAAVWLASQGPYSYFFPRYLLLTVGAWAVLAGIALSRLDLKIAVASLAVIAILGAGDQQVIRAPGAHDWSTYPVGQGGSYQGYAQAAQVIARQQRPGDGIVYQSQAGGDKWLMIGYGLEYYLARDLRPGIPLPRQLFIAETGTQDHGLYPLPCQHPAACLGAEPRIWIVASGSPRSPFSAVTRAQAALLRPHYRLSAVSHAPSLTVFLLVRT
jgi:mannosyltransferase